MFAKNVLLAFALASNAAVVNAQYVEPDWWPLVQNTFNAVNLKRCFKYDGVIKAASGPTTGDACSSKPKTCFFEDQDCAGTPYPLTECICAGSAWVCTAVACPPVGDVPTPSPIDVATTPPVDVATPAPDDVATSPPVDVATPAPVDVATSPPVDVVTPAPVDVATSPPVDVATDLPVDAPTPAPVDGATPAPVDTSVCPALGSIATDPTCSPDGFGCIYTFNESTETEFCNVTSTCLCADGQFGCTREEDCVPLPVCSTLAEIKADPTCSVTGFGCIFTSNENVGDDICTSVERCDCTDSGEYVCTVLSLDCVPRPTCPTIEEFAADQTCAAPGLGCTFTTTAPVGTDVCTTKQSCECADTGSFVCTSLVECVPAPTCPERAAIELDNSCAASAEGLGCVYTTVAPVDGNICTTIESCNCTSLAFACASSVSCEPIPDCPSLPEIGNDPTCTLPGQGCLFTNVETVDDEICTTNSRCNCTAAGQFECGSTVECVDAPTCPTFEVFQQQKTCSSPGLGCGYSYQNNTGIEICSFNETCTCTDAGVFDCEIEQSCMPTPTCPGFSDLQEDKSCSSTGLGCIYNYNNNTGTETCSVQETCTCADDGEFDCVVVVGDCTTNPVNVPCPSFDFFNEDKTCPAVGKKCIYTGTSTSSTQVCVTVSNCECGSDLEFDCIVNETCTDV